VYQTQQVAATERINMKVGFIAATKRHLNYKNEVAARDYYSVSTLPRYILAYCEKNYDQTFIVSFGSPVFLTPDDGVLNVDQDVEQLSRRDKKAWARGISSSIEDFVPLESDVYIHLPNSYNMLKNWWTMFYKSNFNIYLPVKGMSIGKQIAFYKADVGQLPSIKNEEAK